MQCCNCCLCIDNSLIRHNRSNSSHWWRAACWQLMQIKRAIAKRRGQLTSAADVLLMNAFFTGWRTTRRGFSALYYQTVSRCAFVILLFSWICPAQSFPAALKCKLVVASVRKKPEMHFLLHQVYLSNPSEIQRKPSSPAEFEGRDLTELVATLIPFWVREKKKKKKQSITTALWHFSSSKAPCDTWFVPVLHTAHHRITESREVVPLVRFKLCILKQPAGQRVLLGFNRPPLISV